MPEYRMASDSDIGTGAAARSDARHSVFVALECFAGQPAMLLNAAAAVEFANAAACSMLECPNYAALAVKWPRIVSAFGIPALTPSGKTPQLYQANIDFAAGLRPLSLELHALGCEAGSGYFAVLKNPGILDRMEEELLLASERRGWTYLRESLLHDLKGILNSMQISLELISDPDTGMELAQEERRRRRIASMKDGLTRLDRALRLLPGAQEDDEPGFEGFDAGQLVKEILSGLRQLLRRSHIDLDLDLPDGLPAVRGRRSWIRQALLNVAVHRLNNLPTGGSLGVEVRADAKTIFFTWRDNATASNEHAMAESYRFSCPGQTLASTELRVARAVVEAHAGTMTIEQGSAGTTIVLQFPQ